jgi:hypothetical protein
MVTDRQQVSGWGRRCSGVASIDHSAAILSTIAQLVAVRADVITRKWSATSRTIKRFPARRRAEWRRAAQRHAVRPCPRSKPRFTDGRAW